MNLDSSYYNNINNMSMYIFVRVKYTMQLEVSLTRAQIKNIYTRKCRSSKKNKEKQTCLTINYYYFLLLVVLFVGVKFTHFVFVNYL